MKRDEVLRAHIVAMQDPVPLHDKIPDHVCDIAMTRRYYSSRTKLRKLTIKELYTRLEHLYLFFRDQDYFKGKAGITKTDLPDAINHKAALAIGLQPFPITKWKAGDITEDHIFDMLEFLHDHISKPGSVSTLSSVMAGTPAAPRSLIMRLLVM